MYIKGDKDFDDHVKTYGPQSKFGYKDFIPKMKAERFDAAHWTQMFRKAGARYVVPVAEHHDGFPMYDYSFTEWNAAKMGPKRDVIGELAAAVRNQGIHFAASSHRAEHWWFYDHGREFDSDVKDPPMPVSTVRPDPRKDPSQIRRKSRQYTRCKKGSEVLNEENSPL